MIYSSISTSWLKNNMSVHKILQWRAVDILSFYLKHSLRKNYGIQTSFTSKVFPVDFFFFYILKACGLIQPVRERTQCS